MKPLSDLGVIVAPTSRMIDMIVIHCSATPSNRHYPVTRLISDHRARGFACAGYHFYITREGAIYPTRPLEEAGAHVAGFNSRSVGVCYEGGIDPWGRCADTRTLEQKKSLALLIQHLTALLHPTYVVGHRSINPHKECPCYDVHNEYPQYAEWKSSKRAER